jgi:hypothetical protein
MDGADPNVEAAGWFCTGHSVAAATVLLERAAVGGGLNGATPFRERKSGTCRFFLGLRKHQRAGGSFSFAEERRC